jgi:serine protease
MLANQNKPMRKIYFALALLLGAGSFSTLNAQTVYSDYVDGKIWFKLKDHAVVNAPGFRTGKESMVNYQQLDFNTIDFLQPVVDHHQVTRLARPYWMVKNDTKISNVYLLEFTDIHQIDVILSKLKASGMVDYAERVPLTKSFLTPNDPSYNSSTQWGLFQINAAQAWNVSTGNASVVVGVVDDAVQINHPDLSANIYTNTAEVANNGIDDDNNGYVDDRQGYDVADLDGDPSPPSSAFDHGTHVAGIVGARSNNSVGVASIGYGIKLLAVKSTNSASSVTNGYDGVVYAVNMGVDVINMSWGGTGSSTTAQNIITWASNQGIVLVAAAGNDNDNVLHYPAAYTECIAVASTSTGDARSSFSCYGTWVDVAAPGSSIYSTIPGSAYAYKQGTSMASPMVAGLAALIKSVNTGMTAADIRNCILSTADNIDAANPSFIGQLGSGRIDAFAAVTCASATLAYPPVADFSANLTTISAGASINFTDLSIYNPTSWNWSFTGGTPATSTSQNPANITYNTPGTYAVSLTATNANGNDVETKTAYITVNPQSGCDTLNWSNMPAEGGSWTLTQYYTGASVGADGWINGMNVYLDKEKAAYFDASANTQNYIVGCFIAFGEAYSANQNKVVPIKVYNQTGSNPGTVLGTYNLTMGEIMGDVSGSFFTYVQFATPIAVPANRKFYVAADLSNLQWTAGVKDTLSIVSNSNGQTTPSAIWEKQSDNLWYQYGTAGSWGLNASLAIFPFMTSNPASANITSSGTTVCAGQSLNFDATGSTYEDDMLWTFLGGSPLQSQNITQNVFFNTAGTYRTYLEVLGGGCGMYAVDSVDITVNPTPSISVSTSTDTICPAGSANLSATSTATSYSWSPATGLSSTTIANPVASPTNTTTYTVTGTLGSCSRTSTITVTVDNIPPVASVLLPSSLCINAPIAFNGAISDHANSYAWTFTGGRISSSTAATPSVTYTTAGSYAVTLDVTSLCGFTDDTTFNVNVIDCASAVNELGSEQVAAYMNNTTNHLMITWNLASAEPMQMMISNAIGQVVYTATENNTTSGNINAIDMSNVNAGVYFLTISNGTQKTTYRFMR